MPSLLRLSVAITNRYQLYQLILEHAQYVYKSGVFTNSMRIPDQEK